MLNQKKNKMRLIPKYGGGSKAVSKGVTRLIKYATESEMPRGMQNNNKPKPLLEKFNSWLRHKGMKPVESLTPEQEAAVADLFSQLRYKDADLYTYISNSKDYKWTKHTTPGNKKRNMELFVKSNIDPRKQLHYSNTNGVTRTALWLTKDGRLFPSQVYVGGNPTDAILRYGKYNGTNEAFFKLDSPQLWAEGQGFPNPMSYPNKVPKIITKPFFIEEERAMMPGTYLTGDQTGYPMGYYLFEYRDNPAEFMKAFNYTGHGTVANASGLATDSYRTILSQGQRPGMKVRYSAGDEGFVRWNGQSLNKELYDLTELAYHTKDPKIQQQAIEAFNAWARSIYPEAHGAYIHPDGYVHYPHPWIFKDYLKRGGIFKLINKRYGNY